MISFLLTNARSLTPKIGSLIEYFDERDLTFALVTETWFTSGRATENNIADLSVGVEIATINKNRHHTVKKRGGGVALLYHKQRCSFKERKIKGNKYEIVCAIGKLRHNTRQCVVFVVYIPPDSLAETYHGALSTIADEIAKVKSDLEDPYIIVGGDLNGRNICLLYTSPSPRD